MNRTKAFTLTSLEAQGRIVVLSDLGYPAGGSANTEVAQK